MNSKCQKEIPGQMTLPAALSKKIGSFVCIFHVHEFTNFILE